MAGPAAQSEHRARLAALGLLPWQIEALARYLDVLAAWSRLLNLTAARTPAARVDLLVGAVLPGQALLEAGRLLDVGSGNGSPGLVLAVLRPELATTLLEPRRRRWAFLREAARAAGRGDAAILRLRHDEYDGPPARNVTLRALRLPLSDLTSLVEPGGHVLVFGGAPQAAPPFRLEATMPLPQGALRSYRRDVPRET